jgi:hypothetical protein
VGAIDDLILRDDGTDVLYSLTDPNWNVVALLSDSGSVQERYLYNPNGESDPSIDCIYDFSGQGDCAILGDMVSLGNAIRFPVGMSPAAGPR